MNLPGLLLFCEANHEWRIVIPWYRFRLDALKCPVCGLSAVSGQYCMVVQ